MIDRYPAVVPVTLTHDEPAQPRKAQARNGRLPERSGRATPWGVPRTWVGVRDAVRYANGHCGQPTTASGDGSMANAAGQRYDARRRSHLTRWHGVQLRPGDRVVEEDLGRV